MQQFNESLVKEVREGKIAIDNRLWKETKPEQTKDRPNPYKGSV